MKWVVRYKGIAQLVFSQLSTFCRTCPELTIGELLAAQEKANVVR